MIIFIYGEDSFRAKKYAWNIIATYTAKYPQSLDYFWTDFEEDNLRTVRDRLSATSLFDQRKLAVLKGAFASATSGLLDFFRKKKSEKDPDKIFLILEFSGEDQLIKKSHPLFNYLKLHAKPVKEFNLLKLASLTKWTQDQIEEYGFKAKPEVVKILASLGPDLYRLSNEISKLLFYAASSNRKTIDLKDVELLVETDLPQNNFVLTDAILGNNSAKTIFLFDRYMKEEGDIPRLLSLFSYQARAYLMVEDGLSLRLPLSEIAQKSGLHPFVVRKLSQVQNSTNHKKTKNIIDLLPQLEYNHKQGKDINYLFTQLF